MTFKFRLYLNETIDISREYCSFDGYRPGAHLKLVYSGEVTVADGSGKNTHALDSIFETFNIAHPNDYKDRSLSVGDVVVLDNGAETVPYACGGLGWERIANFDPSFKNPDWIDRDEYFKNQRKYEAQRRVNA